MNMRSLIFCSFVFFSLLFVQSSDPLAAGSESSEVRDEAARLLLRVKDVPPTWKIRETLPGDTPAWRSVGSTDRPLRIVDRTGKGIGEIYQVEQEGQPRGSLVVLGALSDSPWVHLVRGEWIIDRAAEKLKKQDIENPLVEPSLFVVVDEDQLVLWADLGKREIRIDAVPFDLHEAGGAQ